MADEVMAAVGAAVELGRAGERGAARDALAGLWERVGEGGDALHRCSVAHYLADLQDDLTDELVWDLRALAAVSDLDDQRARRYDGAWQVRAFLPSLHLNLADVYRRLGRLAESREHLAVAVTHVDALPDDEYGAMIRGGVDRVGTALASGSRGALE
ncbi:hypothetical protein AB0M54_15205 [Actinoplanes sp. NPDC051470]|uniref:hypothetical protein n=1 Tax=unclassified Actinoplanes TaxID=2626549 RepID=UPI0034239E37